VVLCPSAGIALCVLAGWRMLENWEEDSAGAGAALGELSESGDAPRRLWPGVVKVPHRGGPSRTRGTRLTIVDDRTDLARLAVDAFVEASLACMENPVPGSVEEQKCECLIERAQHRDFRYLTHLWRSFAGADWRQNPHARYPEHAMLQFHRPSRAC
jgi:hypothetical protein